MSAPAAPEVLRPAPGGLRGWAGRRAIAALPLAFRVLREAWPIAHLGRTYVVTRHDDVREVFATDHAFQVPYAPNLDVITGGEPFLLGMADSPAYHAGLRAMRDVVRPEDLPVLGQQAEAQAQRLVAASGGQVEVVGLIRQLSFDLLGRYFGIPGPGDGSLALWGTRLFEFQFASSPKDADLRAQVDRIAPAFRAHIDREIARRKAADAPPGDDVLARCLHRQAQGIPGYSDIEIRTALLCMVVGGPPQPPMVVPQALEQLLRRPAALAMAQAAARADDDAQLWRILREAMRFDPLAPGLPRIAATDWVLARGTRRAQRIPAGSTVIAAFSSAMMDPRRLPEPGRFDPARQEHEYIHFGHGLHECFGRQINEWILARMVKPILRCASVQRAPGPEGHLTKRGPFADRLVLRLR